MLHRIDLADLHPALATTDIVVASDVDNPPLGANGAAAVNGPQKGAGAGDVTELDAALHRWATLVRDATGVDLAGAPGAGAAGGVGFGALAALGARMRPGIELILDLVDFSGRVQGATFGHHRGAVIGRTDPAGQGAGRCCVGGPHRRCPGGSGRGPLPVVPASTAEGRYPARLCAHRALGRPRSVPPRSRAAAGTGGSAGRPRLDAAIAMQIDVSGSGARFPCMSLVPE